MRLWAETHTVWVWAARQAAWGPIGLASDPVGSKVGLRAVSPSPRLDGLLQRSATWPTAFRPWRGCHLKPHQINSTALASSLLVAIDDFPPIAP